ncbi:MAG: phosphoadenylyl-sulfate reductase [Anaerolineales bacterium]
MRSADTLNEQFSQATPEEILLWCWDTFGALAVATSSFQSQSVALLFMISQTAPEMPVLFLDTGFHFPETLAFRNDLTERWGLNLINVKPEAYITPANLTELRLIDPDYCCLHAKVAPLQRALEGKKAWVTGIRRDQTSARKAIPLFSETSGGMLKVMPLAQWSRDQVKSYLQMHQLPEHPLKNAGYLSIGCAPCTVPVVNEFDERSGRWIAHAKTECGLHTLPI